MNLFIVPSWYPSASNPSYGIFVKEQIEMMASERPNWNLGVSTWGQGNQEKLLWVKDHFRNFSKINKHGEDVAQTIESKGYKEYYQPALSWSKKFRKGNLREIVRCNELNYQAYTLEFGKPDVIMVQACYPGILIADYLAAKYNVSIHLHVRLGGFMFEKMLGELGGMKNDLLRSIAGANIITATSRFHSNELQPWISDADVLYNPVNTDFFKKGESTDKYALAVGRLEDEKGFDLLLNAFSNVKDLELKIAGDGLQKDNLSKQIKSLGLNGRVSLIGEASREEIRTLIQNSTFLILPSKYETFGNVLLEAMACGKPVVATKCGGPEEIVSQASGYLSEINADDLSDKISEMKENYNSFDPGKIRKLIEEKFAPHQWIANLEAKFKSI